MHVYASSAIRFYAKQIRSLLQELPGQLSIPVISNLAEIEKVRQRGK
jgi:hypothetical protein